MQAGLVREVSPYSLWTGGLWWESFRLEIRHRRDELNNSCKL